MPPFFFAENEERLSGPSLVKGREKGMSGHFPIRKLPAIQTRIRKSEVPQVLTEG